MEGDLVLDLSSLSDVELGSLAHEVDRTLCILLKIDPEKESELIENRMAKLSTQTWKGVANSTLLSAIKPLAAKPYTSKSINDFLKKFGLKLGDPLTPSQQKVLEKNIKSIWSMSKKLAAKETKTTFSFASVDAKAVANINRHQVFWIGDFYSDKLSNRIQAVTRDVLIKQGYGHKEAAEKLVSALRKEFGITPGFRRSTFAPNVPARYAGNPDLYFRQLASTVGHQSRVFARIQQYSDHDFVTYRLVNPNDEKTGQICQQMSGKVFTVKAGVKQMNQILNAKNPKDVKNVARWLSADEIETKLQAGGTKALENSDATILPPFHPLCRTIPVIEK